MAIQNTLEKLRLKVIDLEERINALSKKNQTQELDGVTIYSKQFLNFKIISPKTLHIKTLNNNVDRQIFIQLKVNFYNFSQQNIKFNLLADKIQIGQEIKNFNNGSNEITIFGTYKNSINDKIEISLFVNPQGSKQITLTNTVLTIWGVSETPIEEYHAIETPTKYFLSFLTNNRLYYKFFNKESNDQVHDFIFLEEASTHSVCCDGDEIIIFKTDTAGNLFFNKLSNHDEIFIANNVSNVSCCFSNESLIFCYISNGEAYYGEIKNNVVISNKKITSPHGKFSSCYLFFNAKNKKTYMILSKKDNSNYLLESVSDAHCSSENIYAISNLNISTL